MSTDRLTDWLQQQNIDPATTLVMRHAPTEPELRRAFGRIAAEERAVFETYQAYHNAKQHDDLLKATHLVSCVAYGTGRALFVGVYTVGSPVPPPHSNPDDDPSCRRLMSLGVPKSSINQEWFDLNLLPPSAIHEGRMLFEWSGGSSGGRSWSRWANSKPSDGFPIVERFAASVLGSPEPVTQLRRSSEAADQIPLEQMRQGARRFRRGDCAGLFEPQSCRFHVLIDGQALPLKYVYACATDQSTDQFTTHVAIRRLNHLGLTIIDLKAQAEEEQEAAQVFDAEVVAALNDPDARRSRLKSAPRHAERKPLLGFRFVRNADVVAEVKDRAGDRCERCGNQAPFNRVSDGTPYLEVHHKTPLARGGPDTVENAEALCPNCHRHRHSGPPDS